ncbi:MAG TPA: BTAD domain-containing putative transcriptional regulator, partial [Thermoanaerobaculia bacterium]
MAEPSHLVPHLERLLKRVEEAETPFVQVWGWPGSGKAALIQALLEREGRGAAALPIAALSSEDAFLAASRKAEGAHTFVVAGEPGATGLSQATRWLLPGQRLVFASDRRWLQADLPATLIAPQEMLLGVQEVAALWSLLTGSELPAAQAKTLLTATDGWWRPLRLAIDATGGAGLDAATPERLLELQPVRLFLRHEVLDALSPGERAHLLTAPAERPTKRGDDWRWIDARGLWVEGEERDHLPWLLVAAVERERRRRRPPTAPRAILVPPPPPEGRPRFSLSLLGEPVVRRREEIGDRDLDCRLKRSLQVLAFLGASTELSASREELIEAVWPEEGEQTIERNFHPTLSYLRRALQGDQKGTPAPLAFRNGVYRLSPEIDWQIDVHDFTRLAEEGRALAGRGDSIAGVDTLQAAWKLYRGPFLLGHYEGWVTSRREVYQRLYLDLLRDLGDLCVRLERGAEAMDAYRSALLEDPLQERIHLAVMRLYAEQGRRDLVKRQYEKLCSLLQDELGVEPLPQTVREYHRL